MKVAKFLVSFLLLSALCTFAAEAQTHKINDLAAPNRKRVGLVLSGGGAKGAAEVPIIRAIEEAGIPIDYIAGTSIGSIIGGLYAVGYTTDEIERIFRTADWVDIFTDRNSRSERLFTEKQIDDTYVFQVNVAAHEMSLPSGIISGDKFMDILSELLLGYQELDSFDDLPTPFACVSYDMTLGGEYVARGGNLPLAIRASMSIPGAFKPVEHNNMVLVDGGVYNNFPVDVVREMGAEIVIGVDLSAGIHEFAQLNNIVGIFDQLTTFMGREKFAENRADVDLYMHPDISSYSSASFTPTAIDSLFARGQREADANRDALLALRKKIGLPEGYQPPVRKPHYSDNTKLYIGEIRFEGFNKRELLRIKRNMDIQPYTTVTRAEFNRRINQIKYSGGFDFVTYTLNNQAPYDLTISVNEKDNTKINVGAGFDTQEMAAIILGTSFKLRGDYFNPSLGLTARLSQNPFIKFDAKTSRVAFGNFGFSYRFKYNDFAFYRERKKVSATTFGQHNVSVYFSDIYLRNFNMSIEMEYEYFDYISSLYAAGTTSGEKVEPQGYLNYNLMGHYESLDSFYFPTSGYSIKSQYSLHTTNGFENDGKLPFSSISYELMRAFSPVKWLTLQPSIYGRTLIGGTTYPYMNCMGGTVAGRYMDQQMPFVGIPKVQLFGNSVLVGAMRMRVSPAKNQYISAIVNYAIYNDSYIDMFSFFNSLLGFGLEYAYNTPLGPISLLLSGTNRAPWGGVYFSFGKSF